MLVCSSCVQPLPRAAYSRNQARKGDARRCAECVVAEEDFGGEFGDAGFGGLHVSAGGGGGGAYGGAVCPCCAAPGSAASHNARITSGEVFSRRVREGRAPAALQPDAPTPFATAAALRVANAEGVTSPPPPSGATEAVFAGFAVRAADAACVAAYADDAAVLVAANAAIARAIETGACSPRPPVSASRALTLVRVRAGESVHNDAESAYEPASLDAFLAELEAIPGQKIVTYTGDAASGTCDMSDASFTSAPRADVRARLRLTLMLGRAVAIVVRRFLPAEERPPVTFCARGRACTLPVKAVRHFSLLHDALRRFTPDEVFWNQNVKRGQLIPEEPCAEYE